MIHPSTDPDRRAEQAESLSDLDCQTSAIGSCRAHCQYLPSNLPGDSIELRCRDDKYKRRPCRRFAPLPLPPANASHSFFENFFSVHSFNPTMKSSALLGALLAAATGVTARCVKPSGLPACHGGKCLQALSKEELGKDFCSAFLSLPPVPSTVTLTGATETVTTYTSTQTDLTTTVVTSTITSVATALSTSYVFQRRDVENPGATRILSACATKAARISSACSCLLSITVPVPAPTTTVLATATTVLSLATTIASTETETSLTTTTTTASDLAVATIPPNPIFNGNFGTYKTEGHIRPWTNTTAENPGSMLEFSPSSTVCASNNLSYCNTGALATVWPPSTEGGFVDLVQTFRAKPNTQYTVDFLYRCFVAKTPAARVEVFYNGVTRGAVQCPDQSIGFIWPTNRFFFTPDGTGVGEIKFRFYNSQEYTTQRMYHYIAEIRAMVATGPY